MSDSKRSILEDLNLHDYQKKMIGEFKEFTMPIIRSGFPSTPINEIYQKQIISPGATQTKWNFQFVKEKKKWEYVDELPREEPEAQSDEFVLTGAL